MAYIVIDISPLCTEHTINDDLLNDLPMNSSVFEIISVQEDLVTNKYKNDSCCSNSQKIETNKIPKWSKTSCYPHVGASASDFLLETNSIWPTNLYDKEKEKFNKY